MTRSSSLVALCSALPLSDEGEVPEWIHLVPSGTVATNDGRGPYRVDNVEAIMAASLAGGDKLVLDENHSTDLAAPRGEEAPARGWIVALQRRDDGIWGKVDWTDEGRRKIAAKEYRGVSPVIAHRRDGTVLAILRASLTNKPNFKGLTALHQEENMDLRAKLVGPLGLDSTADDDAIVAAVTAKLDAGGEGVAAALQSALGSIAQAVGLDATADSKAVRAVGRGGGRIARIAVGAQDSLDAPGLAADRSLAGLARRSIAADDCAEVLVELLDPLPSEIALSTAAARSVSRSASAAPATMKPMSWAAPVMSSWR